MQRRHPQSDWKRRRNKLAKLLNKALYKGDIDAVTVLIRENSDIVGACLPFLANNKFKQTVLLLMKENNVQAKSRVSL